MHEHKHNRRKFKPQRSSFLMLAVTAIGLLMLSAVAFAETKAPDKDLTTIAAIDIGPSSVIVQAAATDAAKAAYTVATIEEKAGTKGIMQKDTALGAAKFVKMIPPRMPAYADIGRELNTAVTHAALKTDEATITGAIHSKGAVIAVASAYTTKSAGIMAKTTPGPVVIATVAA